MIRLELCPTTDSTYKVLCLGSHCDDIEIGCGGTILKLLEMGADVTCYWVVFSSDPKRGDEARRSAECFLRRARSKTAIVKNFRESFFPYIGVAVKEYFEQLKKEFTPDLVLTHYRNDAHQDHRVISELTWNTFRDHLILEYEVPKYDGDLGAPNVFVELDESICSRKIQYVMESFESQKCRQWFGEETFWAMLRLRGVESNAPGKYAEGFYCRKMVLGLKSRS